MATDFSSTAFAAQGSPPAPSSAAFPRRLLEQLEEWVGHGLCWVCVDPPNGLCRSKDQPPLDYQALAPRLVQVARRGQVQAVVNQAPLLVLALPVPREMTSGAVWVGLDCYRIGPLRTPQLDRLHPWVLDVDDFATWAQQQPITAPRTAQHLLQMALRCLKQQAQLDQIGTEVDQLCEQLCHTYEEISLLYRLTNNLALNRSEQELAATAVQWVGQILPAQGLAIFMPQRMARSPTSGGLWTYGPFPLSSQEVETLLEYLGLGFQHAPCVLNHPQEQFPQWPFPEVHELIVVPVYESERFFGWMIAVNHLYGGEFGSAEVDLLQSISTILGIHHSNTLYYHEQGELLTGIVRSLSSAIDAKDPYTRGHSDRVARVAVRLARQLGCDARTVDTIYLAGLLHDVGKIGIDDRILRKPGRLTPEEFEHIKQHTIIGYEILRGIKQLCHVLPVVLHHHEAWDGSGYPHGLAGECIPYLARVVAVADAFDAMGSDRPYRKGMSDEKLDAVIRQGAGKQWDPKVVEAFFACRNEIRRVVKLSPEEDPIQLRIWPSY